MSKLSGPILTGLALALVAAVSQMSPLPGQPEHSPSPAWVLTAGKVRSDGKGLDKCQGANPRPDGRLLGWY